MEKVKQLTYIDREDSMSTDSQPLSCESEAWKITGAFSEQQQANNIDFLRGSVVWIDMIELVIEICDRASDRQTVDSRTVGSRFERHHMGFPSFAPRVSVRHILLERQKF